MQLGINAKKTWVLGKFITIDEMMVQYKDSYCLLRQYMPQKPQKLGIKIWQLVCSITKFVWNFEIHCGKNPLVGDLEHGTRCEPKLADRDVLDFVIDSGRKGCVIGMDNFLQALAYLMIF